MQDDPFSRAVERAHETEQADAAARRHRRRQQWASGNRTAFRTHATVFAAVNLLLVTIWATTWLINDVTGYPWFLWPLLGWGVGLAAHYAVARPHLRRPGSASARSNTAELAQLAELHRTGALSDDEFAVAKARVIGSA